jgi:hypothetical protein
MNRFVNRGRLAAGESNLGALVDQCWACNVGDAAIAYSTCSIHGELAVQDDVCDKEKKLGSWVVALAVRVCAAHKEATKYQ